MRTDTCCRALLLAIVLALCPLGCSEDKATGPAAPGTEVRFEGAGISGNGSITRRIKNFGSRSACDIRWTVSYAGQTKTASISVLNPGESVERTLRFDGGGTPGSGSLSAEPC